jgi:L-cysteine desulfidase
MSFRIWLAIGLIEQQNSVLIPGGAVGVLIRVVLFVLGVEMQVGLWILSCQF